MSDRKFIRNMPGHNRPALTSDKLGYPVSKGDEEWEKVKKNYVKLPNGMWERKK